MDYYDVIEDAYSLVSVVNKSIAKELPYNIFLTTARKRGDIFM